MAFPGAGQQYTERFAVGKAFALAALIARGASEYAGIQKPRYVPYAGAPLGAIWALNLLDVVVFYPYLPDYRKDYSSK